MLSTMATHSFPENPSSRCERREVHVDALWPAVGEPTAMMTSEVERFVRNRIAAAEVIQNPFPHFYVEGLFPEPFYRELLQNLPADDCYTARPPPYEARLEINLNASGAAKLGAFWVGFEEWINSQRLLDGMSAKFSADLSRPFAFRKDQLQAGLRGAQVLIRTRTLLARDHAHFALGPHTDSPHKFVTAAFYLSKDLSFEKFGTSIYVPKQVGYVDWKSKHHRHPDFDLVKTFPNRPNSLFVFMKTEASFHGVEPGDYPSTGRDVIFWFPEIGTQDPQRRELALPRELFEPTMADAVG